MLQLAHLGQAHAKKPGPPVQARGNEPRLVDARSFGSRLRGPRGSAESTFRNGPPTFQVPGWWPLARRPSPRHEPGDCSEWGARPHVRHAFRASVSRPRWRRRSVPLAAPAWRPSRVRPDEPGEDAAFARPSSPVPPRGTAPRDLPGETAAIARAERSFPESRAPSARTEGRDVVGRAARQGAPRSSREIGGRTL